MDAVVKVRWGLRASVKAHGVFMAKEIILLRETKAVPPTPMALKGIQEIQVVVARKVTKE